MRTNSLQIQLGVALAIAFGITGCTFGLKEQTNVRGQRSVALVPGITIGKKSAPICRYRLSINQQCFNSLEACRTAGNLRSGTGSTGYICESDDFITQSSKAAKVLNGSGPADRKINVIPVDRHIFPSTYTASNLWLGMPMAEAMIAYPDYSSGTFHSRATMLAFEPRGKRPFKDKGSILYTTTAIFMDERLISAVITVAYLGKDDSGVLTSEEFEQIQNEFAKECESFYGIGTEGKIRTSDKGSEVLDKDWQLQNFHASLGLPRKSLGIRVDLLASLSIMANIQKAQR